METQRFKKLIGILTSITLVVAGVIAFNPAAVMAAINTAVDEGTGSISLSSSGAVTVTSTQLGLVKTVFDTSGNCLASSDSDPACNTTDTSAVLTGTELVFVVYVDNTTSINATDVRFQDDIDDNVGGGDYFEFQTDEFAVSEGIMIDTGSIATGATKGAIWTALTTGTSLTNALDGATAGEYCGITGTDPAVLTCGGTGAGGSNAQLDVANSTVTAIKFHVIKRD